MTKQNRQSETRMAVAVLAVVLAAAVMGAGCKKNSTEQQGTEHQHGEEPGVKTKDNEPAETKEPTVAKAPVVANNTPVVTPKVSLKQVIMNAKTWGPVKASWYEKTAPDFALTDITGKQHKLSDYRGKNVMLVFWATWCRPCKVEIPHLIALQEVMGKDNLAILGISYISRINTTEMVEKFVKENERINYAVFSVNSRSMPAPFDRIEYLPSSFFINPDGKIKLATSGVIALGDMKAILEAQ